MSKPLFRSSLNAADTAHPAQDGAPRIAAAALQVVLVVAAGAACSSNSRLRKLCGAVLRQVAWRMKEERNQWGFVVRPRGIRPPCGTIRPSCGHQNDSTQALKQNFLSPLLSSLSPSLRRFLGFSDNAKSLPGRVGQARSSHDLFLRVLCPYWWHRPPQRGTFHPCAYES